MHRRLQRFAEELAAACRNVYGADLVSLAVFGSWARGVATPVSDIDVLLVASDLPSSRGRRMAQFGPVESATDESRSAIWEGGTPGPALSPIVKSPEEVSAGAPLFLDMTDWCEILYDRDGFFGSFLGGLRERLRLNGARRVWAKGGYYWEYKPNARVGEVIEL